MSKRTLEEATWELEEIERNVRSQPVRDPGDWYDRKALEARLVNDLLVGSEWEYDAERKIRRALDRASYVGD